MEKTTVVNTCEAPAEDPVKNPFKSLKTVRNPSENAEPHVQGKVKHDRADKSASMKSNRG
jgi:hypothetical protein